MVKISQRFFFLFMPMIFIAWGAAGLTLKTNTGVSVELSATRETTPALCVKVNETIWYAPLTADAVPDSTIRVRYNGVTYSVPLPQAVYTFTKKTTFTVPDGFTKIDVFAVGGGAGGGGDMYFCGHSGKGGNGGQTVYQTITVSAGQQISVEIGAGGTGGAQNQHPQSKGNPGGNTSFGSVVANGGTPNIATEDDGGWNLRNGADGTELQFATGDTNLDGKLYGAGGGGGGNAYPSCTSFTYTTGKKGGNGGVTGGGNGGRGTDNTSSNHGSNGTFYGAGGGGAAFSSNHTYGQGGNGYQGIVIIRLHN
ncbi:MAG: hypothetical protein LBJ73_03320 [Rickettsiales bacterium]|jgi:hypothetical protein|nr:hypothetical protein [Rickettsiales bacterium]